MRSYTPGQTELYVPVQTKLCNAHQTKLDHKFQKKLNHKLQQTFKEIYYISLCILTSSWIGGCNTYAICCQSKLTLTPVLVSLT